jgi:hypothetical protein
LGWKTSNAGRYIIHHSLLEQVTTVDGEAMNTTLIFYLCPTCFYASETPDNTHEHVFLRVDPGLPGDERRKPVKDRDGWIISPAPYWFYEALIQKRIVGSSTLKGVARS